MGSSVYVPRLGATVKVSLSTFCNPTVYVLSGSNHMPCHACLPVHVIVAATPACAYKATYTHSLAGCYRCLTLLWSVAEFDIYATT